MNYAVYTGQNDTGRPLTLTKVAEGLSRAQANRLAANMRRSRESSRLMVLVYSGNHLRSAF